MSDLASSSSDNDRLYFNDYAQDETLPQEILKEHLANQNCFACGFVINDRYLIRVIDQYYHEQCLRCVSCEKLLISAKSCFIRAGQIFCKDDHLSIFVPKCARCFHPLHANEYVQRSRHHTYHPQCFTCLYCGRQLKLGDQYVCTDGQIICQQDYRLLLANPHSLFLPNSKSIQAVTTSPSANIPPLPAELCFCPTQPFFPTLDLNGAQPPRTGNNKKMSKRPRTILNSAQRKAFKIAFEKGPKPSKKIREQLAKETGLSVRVVQVWFQNQRAKIKKIQRKTEVNGQTIEHGNGGQCEGGSGDSDIKSDGKSPSSIKTFEDSDLEELDVDSGRSSSATLQPAPSKSIYTITNEILEKDPIDKLYHMNSTYFAFS